MSPVKKEMTDFVRFKSPLDVKLADVKLADNSVLHAYGKGTVHLSVFDGLEKINVTLKDVLYVPEIQNKLLSLPSITNKGAEVQFKGQSCKVMINDKVYCTGHKPAGHKHGKLYKLSSEPEASFCFGSTDVKDKSSSMWNLRFGHLGYDNLKLLDNKSLVGGLSLDQKEEFDRQCEGCASEVLQKIKEYVDMAENFTGLCVKMVRSDNAQEYVSESFKNYCKNRDIMGDDTVPYTPQQNGVAEHMNRTIMETAMYDS